MRHLTPIFDVWGSNAEALATDIGESGVTVRQWRNRNNIPPKYWPRIIAEAARKGVKLEWTQFVPPADLAEQAPRPRRRRMTAPLTPEQEARVREIIREEIAEDRVRRSGFIGEAAGAYRRSLKEGRAETVAEYNAIRRRLEQGGVSDA